MVMAVEYRTAVATIADISDKLESLSAISAFDVAAAAKNLGTSQKQKQAKQAKLLEKKRDLENQKAVAELAEKELKQRIALALCEMTPLQRKVTTYHLLDGLTLEKTGEKLAKSYSYMRALWFQARLILAEY